MTRYLLTILTFIICITTCIAQDDSPSPFSVQYPKRETRAVWLTTIGGIDWPRIKATDRTSIERQKEELRNILDQLQRANINTVILQTRVRGTMIYPSAIEPWDDCMTGRIGQDPGYDPLRYAIDECHARGMELHAWLVTIPLGKASKQKAQGGKSIMRLHPELCKTVGDEVFMIPGHPKTADYVASLCKEIVERYDVDGISLDYIRYPESVYKFSDDNLYSSASGLSKAEWKRQNITRIVHQVHDVVKAIKPWVKLSSSPIGKYSNLSRYSAGGWNCRDAVYQDPQAWLRDNIQDMLFPMMYFKGDNFYPFLYNWKECSYGHPVVPGLGIYFLDPREGKWTLNEVRAEMYASRNCGIGGMAFYRSDFLTKNHKGIYDATCNEFCPYPALPCRMTWSNDTIAPSTPQAFTSDGGTLQWKASSDNSSSAIYYNIYASNVYPVDTSLAENLIATRVSSLHYEIKATNRIYFAVTAMDRFGNESSAAQESNPVSVLPDIRTLIFRPYHKSVGSKGKKNKKK